jgi:hypothetical protein
VLLIAASAPIAILLLGARLADRVLRAQPPAGTRRAIELGWRP